MIRADSPFSREFFLPYFPRSCSSSLSQLWPFPRAGTSSLDEDGVLFGVVHGDMVQPKVAMVNVGAVTLRAEDTRVAVRNVRLSGSILEKGTVEILNRLRSKSCNSSD